jgi:FtsP/CotA-like multicopper oxidase with cupredoxin domain
MELSRRDLIKRGLIGGGALALPVAQLARVAISTGSVQPDSPAVERFAVPLPIPPVIRPLRSQGITDFYQVTQFASEAQILPGRKTPIWGYNGITPGPTFETTKGRINRVTIANHLGVPTTTHLHGGGTAPQYDGHPLQLVDPGTAFTYVYPGLNDAATLWYHDHAIDATGRNVWMGLAGMHLVRDQLEKQLGVPMGAPYEIVLVIQDRVFNKDNSLFFGVDAGLPVSQGNFGDVILVNGAPFPFLQVERRKYRFRILNGSNARFYKLELSSGDPLTVIGSHGGFLTHPVQTPDLLITEAERYDVVIDFAKYPVGTQIVLRNTIAPVPFDDPVDPAKIKEVMRFDVVREASSDFALPQALGPPPVAHEQDAILTRNWVFERRGGEWVMNGKPFNHGLHIDAFPKLGTTEIWEFVNKSGGWLHPIHPHLIEFKFLDRNGKPPRPYETGPMDLTALGPNETIRVAIKFRFFRGTYVFHCHNLEHEDHDMMTQFKVV